jgi:O-glycosyl hydrolase
LLPSYTDCNFFVKLAVKISSEPMKNTVLLDGEGEGFVPAIVDHSYKTKPDIINYQRLQVKSVFLTMVGMFKGKETLCLRQEVHIVEADNIGRLKRRFRGFVWIAAETGLVPELAGHEGSQERGVLARDTDAIIWEI